MSNVRSWYDGYLYDKLISPMGAWLADLVASWIPAGSTVMEIGCGPGTLAFLLGMKCSKVVGVDASQRMIDYANAEKVKNGVHKVEFVHADASAFRPTDAQRFDFAVSCFCLHEMDPFARAMSVRGCLSISDTMIIADYLSPFPRNASAVGNLLMELGAGRRHFHNFRDWQRKNGIDGFVDQLGLARHKEDRWQDGCGKTVMVRQA